ncbi:MAG: hypothetical protein U1E23_14830 [Reyranellaceae bacterium]
MFVTRFGERRAFTARDLHSIGGLSDLFSGRMDWPARHFRKWSIEKRELVGRIQRERCANRLMEMCGVAGLYDGGHATRGVGTWRGPDGRPLVHAGDRIFFDGEVYQPGARIGDALFVIGPSCQAPAHVFDDRGRFTWRPASAGDGRMITAHLDEWAWETPEDRDLFQGSLYCSMLCAALDWLPHVFVQAPFGSGKSSLLRYARALLGGAAHPLLQTYTKAFIEQRYSGTGMAFLLDEMESDSESARINRLFELLRLMSDDGAEGGRGSSSGRTRKLDVHGTVTMAATVSDEWRPQDRSRITLLSVRPFISRHDRPPAPPDVIASFLKAAAELSPALRARAIERWDLLRQNLREVRKALLAMGGQPRDADQVGHLIAGFSTMTSDEPLDAERDREQLERFRPFIMSLAEAEDGDDEPTMLLQTIFGLVLDKWVVGERVTIGQAIAMAREPEGDSWRRSLLPYGLMLMRNPGESHDEAWLAIANNHPGLDELLTKYPHYQGKRRRQILRELRKTIGEQVWTAVKSDGHTRIGGTQTRYVLIPPIFLPSKQEEGV